jgi:hypothetical protein
MYQWEAIAGIIKHETALIIPRFSLYKGRVKMSREK